MRNLGCIVLIIAGVASCTVRTADAYTGGPLGAEILGYDPTDGKVFYWLHDGSEGASPRRTFYFNLRSSNPTAAVEAASLEVPLDSLSTGVGAIRWEKIRRRIQPLSEVPCSEGRVAVRSDSLGVDARQQVVRYRLQVNIGANHMQQTLDVDAYCRPSVTIRSIYRIPMRSEYLVVFTYVGRYYCENVDRPVLLVAATNVE